MKQNSESDQNLVYNIYDENFVPRTVEYPKSAVRKHSDIKVTWKNSKTISKKNVMKNFKGETFANMQLIF